MYQAVKIQAHPYSRWISTLKLDNRCDLDFIPSHSWPFRHEIHLCHKRHLLGPPYVGCPWQQTFKTLRMINHLSPPPRSPFLPPQLSHLEPSHSAPISYILFAHPLPLLFSLIKIQESWQCSVYVPFIPPTKSKSNYYIPSADLRKERQSPSSTISSLNLL